MADLSQVHCFYPAVSNRGWPRRNVDNVPSPPVCEEEGPLLRFLREVLHELPFLSSGCAGALPVPVAEAVPARVQAAQVQAGEGEQEETGLRKSGSAQLSCHLLLSCETLTGHCGFLFWKKIFVSCCLMRRGQLLDYALGSLFVSIALRFMSVLTYIKHI